MASIYAYLLEQKKAFTWETPTGLVLGGGGGGGGGSATALPQGNTKIAFSSKSA